MASIQAVQEELTATKAALETETQEHTVTKNQYEDPSFIEEAMKHIVEVEANHTQSATQNLALVERIALLQAEETTLSAKYHNLKQVHENLAVELRRAQDEVTRLTELADEKLTSFNNMTRRYVDTKQSLNEAVQLAEDLRAEINQQAEEINRLSRQLRESEDRSSHRSDNNNGNSNNNGNFNRRNEVQLSVTEIISFIGEFNGDWKNLSGFIDNVDRLYDTLDSHDSITELKFAYAVVSKIKGDSLSIWKTAQNATWSEVKNALLTIHKPKVSMEQMRSRITKAKQENSETITEFGKKILKLYERTISSIIGVTDEVSTYLRKDIEKLAIRAFHEGLKNRDLALALFQGRPSSLKEAIEEAKDAEIFFWRVFPNHA